MFHDCTLSKKERKKVGLYSYHQEKNLEKMSPVFILNNALSSSSSSSSCCCNFNFLVGGPPPPKIKTSPLLSLFPHHPSSVLVHSCRSTLTTGSNSSTFSLLQPRPPPLLSLFPSLATTATPPSSSSSSSCITRVGSDDFGQTTDSDSDSDYEDDAHIPFPPYHHQDANLSPSPLPPDRWDVLGLGQAMVDFSGTVDDEFLGRLGLEKGTRKVVNHEERGRVLRAMDGCSYKAAAGGSLSNTLVALARLGGQAIGGRTLNVAMAGGVGSDPLGGFYRSKLKRANVSFLSEPVREGTTGTVIVLTTPDAQRTMLAYQGTSSTLSYDSCLASSICKTNVLVVEGYLFELPDTIRTITKACDDARSSGALVAVTASDVSCIERHYDDFWDIMANYADIVFANSDEARTFCHFSSKESPISATRYLSHFVPLVSVTDGPRGSYIGVKGEAIYIPPPPCLPVDTCGAGDAYASGILYGILRGVSDLRGMGALAAKVASIVVGQQGTRLRVQDAVELSKSFTLLQENSPIWSDVGSDQISSL